VKQAGIDAEFCHLNFSLTSLIHEHKSVKYLQWQGVTKFFTLVAFDLVTFHAQAHHTNL
jgi:hypothetical protein